MNAVFPFRRVVRTPEDAKAIVAMLKANAGSMVEAGTPIQITASPHKAKRSDEQNRLMWVLLGQIADQVWSGGRRYDAETWHEAFKRQFLPEVNEKGMDKWRILPDGERALAMGTTDLHVSEFTEYLNQLEAHAATELGVQFSADLPR